MASFQPGGSSFAVGDEDLEASSVEVVEHAEFGTGAGLFRPGDHSGSCWEVEIAQVGDLQKVGAVPWPAVTILGRGPVLLLS